MKSCFLDVSFVVSDFGVDLTIRLALESETYLMRNFTSYLSSCNNDNNIAESKKNLLLVGDFHICISFSRLLY